MIILPTFYGAMLYHALEKARTHNYIKRYRGKPDPKTGKPRWVYVYHVAHQGGVHAQDHMVEGSAFKLGDGHYHITQRHGDYLIMKNDETGEFHRMGTKDLRDRLKEFHKEKLAEHKEKAVRDLETAIKNGVTGKARKMLEKRVGIHGNHPLIPPRPVNIDRLTNELNKMIKDHKEFTEEWRTRLGMSDAQKSRQEWHMKNLDKRMREKAAELKVQHDRAEPGQYQMPELPDLPWGDGKAPSSKPVIEKKAAPKKKGAALEPHEVALNDEMDKVTNPEEGKAIVQKYMQRIRHANMIGTANENSIRVADDALREVYKAILSHEKQDMKKEDYEKAVKPHVDKFKKKYLEAFGDDEGHNHPDHAHVAEAHEKWMDSLTDKQKENVKGWSDVANKVLRDRWQGLTKSDAMKLKAATRPKAVTNNEMWGKYVEAIKSIRIKAGKKMNYMPDRAFEAALEHGVEY